MTHLYDLLASLAAENSHEFDSDAVSMCKQHLCELNIVERLICKIYFYYRN